MPSVTLGFQVLPNGQDMDTDGILDDVIDAVKESGVKYDVGPMETVMEGNLDELLGIVKKAQNVGIDSGATEVITNVKIHYRPNGVSLEDKIDKYR